MQFKDKEAIAAVRPAPPYNPKQCNAPLLQYLGQLVDPDTEDCRWMLELGTAMENYTRKNYDKMGWTLQTTICKSYIIPLMKKIAVLLGENRDLERSLDSSISKITEELTGDQRVQKMLLEMENLKMRRKMEQDKFQACRESFALARMGLEEGGTGIGEEQIGGFLGPH